MQSLVLTITLIAATLPFVASILSAFSPATRVRDIEGYFLYDRQLDIDSFLKTTIGYSLQVASIALFFYWTFTYGILGPLVVCAAWTGGYLLMAVAVQRGWFSSFLGTSRNASSASTETIHGFIGNRMPERKTGLKKFGVLAVSLASVIGLGGTMMTEIDYTTGFFISALRIVDAPDTLRLLVELAILSFTALYVLWGGYRSAVFTDRFQTPVAYVAFSVFGFGVAALASKGADASGASIIVLCMTLIFIGLLISRRRLLKEALPEDSWDQLTTIFTFLPIIILGVATLLYLGAQPGNWSWAAILPFLFPQQTAFLGFGMWGAIALIFANGVWQFIDISSLQRLQSLDKSEVLRHREKVVRTLRVTGVEAGVGWFLIILTAVLLHTAGLTSDNFINVLFDGQNAFAMLVPLFIFTVVIYMLSTISGFISALSYISYYDIVPLLSGRAAVRDAIGERSPVAVPPRLNAARLTTVLAISAVFVLYLLLRLTISSTEIVGVLYAIYAFQIAILPSAFVAIFIPKIRVSPLATILSVATGLCVAYWTATHADGWMLSSGVGMDSVSWQVVPPLASAVAATCAYVLVTMVASAFAKLRGRMRTSEHN